MLPFGLVTLFFCGFQASTIPESEETKLGSATNDLAFDLMRSYGSEKNVFISPFSISTALAQVYHGAGGATAEAMRNVLKYDQYGLPREQVYEAFHSLQSRIQENTQDYVLSSLNSALVQDSFPILNDYSEALRRYFSSHIQSVDFANHGEEVKTNINAAVDNATRGKIKDFLAEPLDPETKLFLLNAVYFLGNWKDPFDPYFNNRGAFYNSGVQEKQVEMMNRDGQYSYAASAELGASVTVLPYKGNASASMIVILPDERTGVAEVERKLTQGALNEVLGRARKRRQLLILPKFNISYSSNLVDSLTGLGLGVLFGDSADLTLMTDAARLKVSRIFHKAVINVNERGSEAAGSTGIEAIPLSLPPRFHVDHPFLFVIRDDQSKMILFSGRVDEL